MTTWTKREYARLQASCKSELDNSISDFRDNPSAANFGTLNRDMLIYQFVSTFPSNESISESITPGEWTLSDLHTIGAKLGAGEPIYPV